MSKSTEAAPSSKKKLTIDTAEEPKRKPINKKLTDMIDESLKTLYKSKGTSLLALKKHLQENYQLDEKYMKRMTKNINMYLTENIDKELIVTINNRGLSGHFKLAKRPTERKKSTTDKNETEDTKKETVKKKATKNEKPKKKVEKTKKNVTIEKTEKILNGKIKKDKKIAAPRLSTKRKSIHMPKAKPKVNKKEKKTAPKKDNQTGMEKSEINEA